MASGSKDSVFNILGSSKLNTADGKNPTSSATTSTSTQPSTPSGQKKSEEYRQECSKAHDALEDRLRDEGSRDTWDVELGQLALTQNWKEAKDIFYEG
ncbi:MAG: hypothetical protein Q9175_006173 [Cornicularia normoerica]